MKNGYTLGVLLFFIGVVVLMITDQKFWHYVTFLLAVVVVAVPVSYTHLTLPTILLV